MDNERSRGKDKETSGVFYVLVDLGKVIYLVS